MNSNRQYEIIAFGATGFTGQLVAEYLANKSDESFSWAIAGRNLAKLQEVKAKLGLGDEVGLIVADTQDDTSLTAMTSQANVLLTTVGPYAKYGEPLVNACVETGTNYVDITGEPEFVNHIIEKYDDVAKEKGIRLVNCCGFDSIPHDLGAYMMVKAMSTDQPISIEGFVSASGTMSGGTWHSAVNAFSRLGKQPKRLGEKEQATVNSRKVRGLKGKAHYAETVKGWVAPMPTIDPQIILRSAQLLPLYGDDFQYGHYMRVGTLPNLIGLSIGLMGMVGLAQLPLTRNLLFKWKQLGDGPTAEQRAKSHFRVKFVGTAGEQQFEGEVSGGDPGYGETSKMISESALCLALDHAQLPERYGVLTTATAMGDRLIERLRAAGMKFEMFQR